MRPISPEKLVPVTLGKLDKFVLRLLRAGELPIRAFKDEKIGTLQVLRLYGESLRAFPVSVTVSIVGVLVGSIAMVMTPYVFKLFLDILAAPHSAGQVHTAINYIYLLFAVGFVGWAAWRIAYLTIIYISTEMLASLRQLAFSSLLGHSHHFFSKNFSGALVQKINRFASSFDAIMESLLFQVVPTIVQVSIIMFILAKEHYLLAGIIIVWVIIFITWNYYFAIWKLKFDISRAAQNSEATGKLADAITNQQTIELHNSQYFEKEKYRKATELQSLYSRFLRQSSILVDGVPGLLFVIINFIVMYVGVTLWEKGEISVAMFVLVQIYLIQLSDRLWSFSHVIRDVYEGFANGKEMADIMYMPQDIKEVTNPRVLKDCKGDIVFDHVRFSFEYKNVVDDLSLHIKQGEKIALVGLSGAGKSTIVKLLFRQYDPDSGSVSIDGENIHNLTIASLRGALSLVPQDPVLFHRSLLENIRYGKEGATDEEVYVASRLAHCDDFIEKLPEKYNTFVGERGIRLSGGERQRVAIARSFLRNSPILVLDEATSSLDSHSEERIQDSLMKLMEGKTTIIIAHRLSTIRRMDRIIVIDEGKVAEDGPHDALLARGGIYAKLWNIQQGGFLKDEDQEEELK